MKPRSDDAARLESEYIEQLKTALSVKQDSESADIIQSVKEHIEEAVSEIADHEVTHIQMANVLERLGPPESFAEIDGSAPARVSADEPLRSGRRYTKRDLKAFDMFALLLVGIGLLFLALGGISMVVGAKGKSSQTGYSKTGIMTAGSGAQGTGTVPAAGKFGKGKVKKSLPGFRYLVLGFVFLVLGLTLNIGLRRVIKNKGYDVDDMAGVGN